MNKVRWIAVIVAALTLAGCGVPGIGAAPIARVDNVSLSEQDLDARVKRVQDAVQKQQAAAAAGAQQQPAPTADDIKRGVVSLFVEQNLVLNIAKQRNVTVGDAEVDAEITRVRGQVEQGGQKLDDIVQGRLGLPGADSTDFRQFMSYLVAQQKLAATLVTTDTVRQEVTAQVMPRTTKQVEQIDVAHILVKTEDEAKQAIARLQKGEDFAALAKELSTDPGSKDNGGEYKGIKRGQFIPEFEKAAFDELKPGEYTQTPVKSQYGYHVIKLISKTQGPDLTEEQAKQTIEQTVQQEVAQRQQQALGDLIKQEHDKAKTEGRLVEPDYVSATAVPAPAAPEGTTAPAQQPPSQAPTTTP